MVSLVYILCSRYIVDGSRYIFDGIVEVSLMMFCSVCVMLCNELCVVCVSDGCDGGTWYVTGVGTLLVLIF